MTPGEHYAEAERLVGQAQREAERRGGAPQGQVTGLAALAQVHATLASAGPSSPADLAAEGEPDVAAAACLALRTVLELFRSQPGAADKDRLVAVMPRAALVDWLNRLAVLERGEVPA